MDDTIWSWDIYIYIQIRRFTKYMYSHYEDYTWKYCLYIETELLSYVSKGIDKSHDCLLEVREPWRIITVTSYRARWRLNCLLNCLFWRRSKKTSKLRVTGLCERNSPVTGEFPAQRANDADNVSIWWRHNDIDEIEWHQTNAKHNSKAYIRLYNLQLPLLLISYIFSRIYSNILGMHVWGDYPSYIELFILWPHTSVYVIRLTLIGTPVVRFSISGTLTAVLRCQYISQRTIYSKGSNSIWI